ncbi:claudin-9 [Columba livia]|nr:claudin-9 [Columba livia]
MASMGLQVLGIALSVIGWLATILCCALPMWRETAFVGNNIVTAQIIWEGLWMNCVVQSTGQMQCKFYDSLLALPQDLQAARAMVVVAIVLAVLGTLLAVTGGKCTNCVEDDTAKAKVMIISGIIFIIAGVLILIPISWSANSIIQDFYNPMVTDSQKRDLGSSLYVLLMATMTMQLGGLLLAALGWLGSILTCALPMWKVTAFIGSNIVVAQVFWEGLWMNCVYETTGQMQCKAYDSLLELTSDLQAARALVVTSIFVALFAFLTAISGADCTRCVDDKDAKTRISIVAGAIFVLAGIMLLIPVSWSANSIVTNFYNPMVPAALKRELGAALYIGWAASALLLFGGGILCCSGPPSQQDTYPKVYRAVKGCSPMAYPMKDYV